MKRKLTFFACLLPLALAASTGWWFLFSPGRISKEVWTEKDEVFCGAVFSPLDSTDTLGRADQRWPGQWNQMFNCSTYFRGIGISGKFYIIDAYNGQLYGLWGYAKNTEIVHDVGRATGVRGDGICTEEYSLEAVGVRGYGKNEGDGDAYGGYFYGYSDGTGIHYGIYAESDSFGIYAKTTALSKNWAGYFEGNINITDTAKALNFVGHHSGLSDSSIYSNTAVYADSAAYSQMWIDSVATLRTNMSDTTAAWCPWWRDTVTAVGGVKWNITYAESSLYADSAGYAANAGVISQFSTGAYAGSGVANRNIDVGFTPDAVWVYPVTSNVLASHGAAISGYHSQIDNRFAIWKQDTALFQGIVTNGFKTGTNVDGEGTNLNGITYFWIALKN